MLKRLYDERDEYNEEGMEFYKQIGKIFTPLIDEYVNKGFSCVDMDHIAGDQFSYICFMKNAFRVNKKEKMKEKKKGYGKLLVELKPV